MKNLFDKVWDAHKIGIGEEDSDQLFIDTHLIHEVTTPQAFAMLEDRNIPVLYPERTIATVDHIIPTDNQSRPFQDPQAESMISALEENTKKYKIKFFPIGSSHQGIVHVMAPELGLVRPGMTIACGDSHTSTHGAFGAIAFGIGTSQVRDVLASQTLKTPKLKVRKIEVSGKLQKGVSAKDLILHIIEKLGSKGGVGYAYEYCGSAIESLSMDQRMTLCNMSIEGGARCGYVNPDQITYQYLKNCPYAPQGEEWDNALALWDSIKSDKDARYDDEVLIIGDQVKPMVTWGISPDQSVSVEDLLPDSSKYQEAFDYMGWGDQKDILGTDIDVAFIGSCTNGRYEDFLEVSRFIAGRKVSKSIKRALAVPGSAAVAQRAEAEGIAEIFRQAGFQWRKPGCSMCLAMNPDRLEGREICASSSNRNFKGRQGSATGRTLLMSPLSVAAAAITGKVSDPRKVFQS